MTGLKDGTPPLHKVPESAVSWRASLRALAGPQRSHNLALDAALVVNSPANFASPLGHGRSYGHSVSKTWRITFETAQRHRDLRALRGTVCLSRLGLDACSHRCHTVNIDGSRSGFEPQAASSGASVFDLPLSRSPPHPSGGAGPPKTKPFRTVT